MADETKTTQEGNAPAACASKGAAAALPKVIVGLVFLGLAVYLLLGRGWWEYTWYFMKACAAPFLALAGIITLAIAKE